MPIIPGTTGADRLYRRWRPLHHGDEQAGYPLYALAEALTSGTAALEEIVREDDTHAAWARAVDVDEAPLWVLPWLGCLVGVETLGDPTEQLRRLIRTRPRWKRGTTPAIRAAVEDTLTATKTVRVYSRVDDTPFHLLVLTDPSETPDPVLTEAAARGEKPAMVVLQYAASAAPYIPDGSLTIDAGTGTIDTHTMADVT